MDDDSMMGPTKMSNAQGQEYQALHEGQHGGAQLGEGAPVGDTGVLDQGLRTFARVTALDHAIGETVGMRDQSGGRRRRTRRKHGGRKHGGSRKKHGGRRRRSRRRHSGGGMLNPASAELHARSAMILDSSKTEHGMNPEWKLAHNPNSMAPSM